MLLNCKDREENQRPWGKRDPHVATACIYSERSDSSPGGDQQQTVCVGLRSYYSVTVAKINMENTCRYSLFMLQFYIPVL